MAFIDNPEELHQKELLRPKNIIPQDQLLEAKLYSDRLTFIDTLPKNISFLEVGVLAGDFAIEVIKRTLPSKTTLIDPFWTTDEFAKQYGKARWDKNEDHYSFVKNRFKNMPSVKFYKGTYKSFGIENQSDTFDFIYIDYTHSSDATNEAIGLSTQRLNPGGILGFNDYCEFANPNAFEDNRVRRNGVVGAINYFLRHNKDWYVYAFAFNEGLSSDIYLKKREGGF
jgi:hypothetical protein